MEDIYGDFWQAFLEQTGTPENSYCNRCTYFGESEEESVEIMEQLLRGEKSAISHCVPHYIVTRSPMPKVGDYTMVTDYYGNPGCILKCTDVVIDPIGAIPAEIAEREGQGGLEIWQQRKRQEFQALSQKSGFHYNDELPILMELVETVFPGKE